MYEAISGSLEKMHINNVLHCVKCHIEVPNIHY